MVASGKTTLGSTTTKQQNPHPVVAKSTDFRCFFCLQSGVETLFFRTRIAVFQNSVQNSCTKHAITYHLSPITSHFLSVPFCCFCRKWRSFFAKWCAVANCNKMLLCVLLQWCACLDFVCCFSTHVLAVLYLQQQARGSILPTFSHTYCRFCKSYYKTHYTKHTLTSRFSLISTHVLAVLQNFYKTHCTKTHRNLSLITSHFSLSLRPVVRF